MNLKQGTNRRNPTQSRSKERVTVILEAVKEIIEDKGIGKLTIAEIARRANTSQGSIYQYFSDKETLIISLAEHFMDKIHLLVDNNLSKLNSLADLESVLSQNFDDIYLLHKDESALRQIWFESLDSKLSKLAMLDAQLNSEKIYQRLLQVAKPKDNAQLKQCIFLMSVQFGTVISLCFSSDVATPEQFKKIYVETAMLGIFNYIEPK
jgi:AcrR family transcriptional regulator